MRLCVKVDVQMTYVSQIVPYQDNVYNPESRDIFLE